MDQPSILRLTTEEERNQIKNRTKQLIHLAGGGECFAASTGVNKAQLSKYGNVSEPESFIRADVIVELCRQIGAPMMIETLAQLVGYRLEPTENQAPAAVGLDDLEEVSRETSDVVQKLAASLRGGIDVHENRDLRKEIAEAIAALQKLDRKLAGAPAGLSIVGGAA